jgi:hypothetical protein
VETNKLTEDFNKKLTKRRYVSILKQSMIFSAILVSFMFLIHIITYSFLDIEWINTTKKIFNVLWITYLIIFVLLTLAAFFTNKDRTDLFYIDKGKEFDIFKRQQSIKEILKYK